MTALPIHDVLPDLLAALRTGSNAVLVAPPGAGKTTAVAPALLDQPWCSGQILLLSPRRLAARAAAERIAEMLGEQPGGTVGYATRMDSKQSARTRLLVLTEGIFVRRIQDDPNWRAYPQSCSTRSMNAASTAISASPSRSTRRKPCAPICASCPCPPRSTARDSPPCWATRQ